ncbi:MAG: hypothetical protein NTY53_21045, partial [Kiritimatiellaeota bacterium]|nr:hypothetical protein [Kiritimatiellota bacterium]
QTFLTPAWAHWDAGGTTNSVAPPLLSWVSRDAASSDFWLTLGLGKFSWGAKPGSQYLLPLFYHDREKELFLSPLWAEWKSGADSTTLIPPILSWKNTQPERSDLWLTLGLGRFSWGEKAGSQWLLPLFYQDRNEKTFISPLWAHWPSPDGENSAVPLALSWLTSDEQSKNFWLALGLGKFSWGEKPSSSYLFPFYYHDPRSREFYSLLYGSDPSSDGFTYFATPLVGKRNGEQHAGSWVFPLYSHKRDVKTDEVNDWLLWGNHWERNGVSRSIFIPLFGYHNFGDRDALPARVTAQEHRGKDFFCIPYCWYQNETYVRCAPGSQNNNPPVREDKFTHGVFPLWSYADVDNPAEGRKNTDGSCLLWLYDYTREVGPLANAPAGTNDYTRARVLWHLWHYERLNGDVSVDVFPGITYDRKNDGFKKISWLWRLFRYERDKNGGVDLDVWLIPFRQGAEKRK